MKWTVSFWSNAPLRLKALIVASLPIVALLMAVLLINRLEHTADQAEYRADQLRELRAQAQSVDILLIAAESAVRNYALTGHEEGIQPLTMVGPSADAVFDKIRDLIRSDPGQIEQLVAIRRLTHQRIAGLFRLRDFYDAHRADHAAPPEALTGSARVSPDLLLPVSALAASQLRIVQEQDKVDQARELEFRIAIGVCIGVGLLGGFLLIFLFATGVVRRIGRLEASASQLAQGQPSSSIVGGTDELGRLGLAMEKAGEILANRDRELRLALETAKLLIWELNADTRQISYHSGGSTDRSIIPVELLAPTVEGWVAGVHSGDRDAVRAELERVMTAGGVLDLEYRVVIRGGETRWMAVTAQYQRATSATPDRLLGVISDITAQRHAALEIEHQAGELAKSKQALEGQTRILRSILDSMGDGVVVADPDGQFLVFNPAAEKILGGRPFAGGFAEWAKHYGLFLPDGRTLYPAADLPIVQAIQGQSVDGAEILVRAAGASEGAWTNVTARPFRDESGKICGGIIVFRDVTSAKRGAKALEAAKRDAESANQAKSDFLSRMSHELRTPLNSILGFAQLLELANLAEEDRNNVELILKGGYHLLDLINEILDLARIEAGRLSLSPEPVSTQEALSDALDLVSPLAAERNVRINGEDAVRRDWHIRADRQRLKQVLLNLLSNAIKFNREGGFVSLTCEERPGNRLRIQVADSGIGISPEGLSKLFTPFERLSADRTEVGGSGLGLALSRRLVEAMGGVLGVESTPGIGSKFFVELDVLQAPAEELDQTLAALETEPAEPHRGTILYIEDNLSNLRLVERILAHSPNVRLISAMQGQMGLDLAHIHVPDWILLDVHLPDIPGDEVLLRLRQNPRTRHIPVTVLSADATSTQISRLLGAGARDYLTKPLDVRQLLGLLDEILHNGTEEGNLEGVHAEGNCSE